MVELYQLKQFLTIADSKSLREAAEKLYLSGSALSQSIHRLEQELGCELFDRSHKRLAITLYGKILQTHAKAVFAELSYAQDEIDREKLIQEKVLKVGHFSMPMTYIRMPRMAQKMPDYSFDVHIDSCDKLMQGLLKCAFDFIILPDSGGLSPGLAKVAIENERACLSVPASSRLYTRDTVTLSELSGEKVMFVEDLLGATEWYAQLIECANAIDIDLKVVQQREYLFTMSESDYIHFSTDLMVDFLGLGNNRRRVEIVDAEAERTVAMIYRQVDDDRLEDIVSHFKKRSGKPFENTDAFPFLLFQNAVPNICISLP